MGRRRTTTVTSVWWYIVRTDEFPYGYWNRGSDFSGQIVRRNPRWVGSFWGYATKYPTEESAEKEALLLVVREPGLMGKIKVIERAG